MKKKLFGLLIVISLFLICCPIFAGCGKDEKLYYINVPESYEGVLRIQCDSSSDKGYKVSQGNSCTVTVELKPGYEIGDFKVFANDVELNQISGMHGVDYVFSYKLNNIQEDINITFSGELDHPQYTANFSYDDSYDSNKKDYLNNISLKLKYQYTINGVEQTKSGDLTLEQLKGIVSEGELNKTIYAGDTLTFWAESNYKCFVTASFFKLAESSSSGPSPQTSFNVEESFIRDSLTQKIVIKFNKVNAQVCIDPSQIFIKPNTGTSFVDCNLNGVSQEIYYGDTIIETYSDFITNMIDSKTNNDSPRVNVRVSFTSEDEYNYCKSNEIKWMINNEIIDSNSVIKNDKGKFIQFNITKYPYEYSSTICEYGYNIEASGVNKLIGNDTAGANPKLRKVNFTKVFNEEIFAFSYTVHNTIKYQNPNDQTEENYYNTSKPLIISLTITNAENNFDNYEGAYKVIINKGLTNESTIKIPSINSIKNPVNIDEYVYSDSTLKNTITHIQQIDKLLTISEDFGEVKTITLEAISESAPEE